MKLPISQKMFFINICEVVKGWKSSIWWTKATSSVYCFPECIDPATIIQIFGNEHPYTEVFDDFLIRKTRSIYHYIHISQTALLCIANDFEKLK